jgi:L-ribulose-5-phosphate 3-epimerase
MNPQTALSRRSFLAGLGSGMVFSFAGRLDAGPFTGRIWKAVKYSMIRGNLPLVDKFRTSQDAGFDGISLIAPGVLDLKETLAAQDKTGLRIHNVNDAVHWNVRLSDPDPAVRQQAVQALRDALQFASDCGADSVLLVIGKVTDPDHENHEQVRERSIRHIREVIPRAAQLGVRILCENVGNGFCPEAKPWAEYLDAFASPWVGAFFDIGNHHGHGGAPHWIRTLGSRVVKIDVKDRNMDTNRNCNLFAGHIDWEAVRQSLAEIGFTGWATAEVDGGDARQLKQVAQQMDRALGI